MSVLIRATRRHLPEDDNHHSHRRGNLKSYDIWFVCTIGDFKFGVFFEQNEVRTVSVPSVEYVNKRLVSLIKRLWSTVIIYSSSVGSQAQFKIKGWFFI
jgi:hypothetical protein